MTNAEGHSRGSRWRRRILILASVLVLCASVAWFARAAIVGSVARAAARDAGLELDWDDLTLEGISRLRIEGLRVRRPLDLDVRADAIEAEFDVRALAKGDWGGLHRLKVAGLDARLGPFLSTPSTPGSRAPGPIRWPTAIPRVDADVRSLAIDLGSHRAVRLTNAELSIEASRGSLTAERAAWIDGTSTIEHPLSLSAHYDAGKFEFEDATWDERIVLERASADVTDASAGRAAFTARARAFGSRIAADGRLADGLLDARARVDALDVGAALDAFLPESGADLDARVSLDLVVHVPIEHAGDASGSLRAVATDVRFGTRAFDRLELDASGTVLAPAIHEALVLHGANAVRLEALFDRPLVDPCSWYERVDAWVDGDVHDLGSLLGLDVGFAAVPIARAIPPLAAHVTAGVGHGLVDGRVLGRDLDVRAVTAMCGVDVPIEARADVDVRVHVPLTHARDTSFTADVSAVDVSYAGRVVDFLAGRLSLGDGAWRVEDAFVAQGRNSVEIPFALVPLDPCRMPSGSSGRVRADLADVPRLWPAEHTSSSFANLPEHRLLVEADVGGGALSIDSGAFACGSNAFTIVTGRVPLHEDPSAILRDENLDVGFSLRFDDVASAVAVLAPDAFAPDERPSGRVAGRARLRGASAGPRGRLLLTVADLRARGETIDSGLIEADLDETALELARLDARSTLGTVHGAGRYQFADHRFVGVNVSADLNDLEPLWPGVLPRGRVRVEAHLDGAWPKLGGDVDARADELRLAGETWTNVALRGRLTEGHARIEECSANAYGLSASASGDVDALDADARTHRIVIDRFDVSAGERANSISAPVTVIVGPGRFEVDALQMAGGLGFVDASARVVGDEGRVAVRALGIEPARFPVTLPAWLPRTTRGDVQGSAEWDAGDVRLTTSGRIEAPREADTGEPDSRHGSLTWRLTTGGARARIEELALEWIDDARPTPATASRAARVMVTGDVPLDVRAAWNTRAWRTALSAGDLTLDTTIELDDASLVAPASTGLEGRARLDAQLAGTWPRVSGNVNVSGRHLSVPATRAESAMRDADLDLRLRLGDDVTLESGSLRVGQLVRLDVSGRLAAVCDVRRLVNPPNPEDPDARFAALADASWHAKAELEAVDLAPIAALVPALRRTGGQVDAWVEIDGTPRAPQLRGQATLSDGEIRTSSSLPSIAGVTGLVRLEDRTLKLEDLHGELGGAPFRLSGEILAFDPHPSFDMKLTGESLLLWREGDVTVRADSDLSLQGPLEALNLRGTLTLRDSHYTKKIDFLSFTRSGPASARDASIRLFSLEDPPFSNVKLDVRVTTASPFQIANNVARGALAPDLTLLGTGREPQLRGVVLIEPSRVLLPSGSLKVRTGRVEFRPDRPGIPVLDVQAGARLQGYDVDVNVTGPLDNPRVDLSSVPPLSREDLALLLITGRPPGDSLTLAGGQRAAVDVAVYIARDVAAAWLEGDDEADFESLAERLEVVLGADRTRSGADSVLVRMRLTEDVRNTGNALYLTGERDVYDYYNFGLRLVLTFP